MPAIVRHGCVLGLLIVCQAVEDYYIRLVSGAACLSDIGLAPAGAAALEQPAAVAAYKARPVVPEAAAEALRASEQVALQEQQQVQQLSSAQQQNARRTYKVYVSYLGSSFAGWARQPGRLSVEGTLAAAVAAAGLTGIVFWQDASHMLRGTHLWDLAVMCLKPAAMLACEVCLQLSHCVAWQHVSLPW